MVKGTGAVLLVKSLTGIFVLHMFTGFIFSDYVTSTKVNQQDNEINNRSEGLCPRRNYRNFFGDSLY